MLQTKFNKCTDNAIVRSFAQNDTMRSNNNNFFYENCVRTRHANFEVAWQRYHTATIRLCVF